MIEKLYNYRFECFLFSLLSILFGSLLFPFSFFDVTIMPILFLLNLIFGILLISKKKIHSRFMIILFGLSLLIFGIDNFKEEEENLYSYIRFGIYFLFYVIVTLEIIKQVWNAKFVNKNVVIGLMSGYLSLGFVAFFIFSTIELSSPGSFSGIEASSGFFSEKVDSLIYYGYITLLTVGYGDIIPLTPIAQKASVLVGLIGQFYIVIITAVIVEKYFVHNKKDHS